MNLIVYLYRRSWRILFFTAFCGIVTGLSGAAMIGMIGKAIASQSNIVLMAWQFFGLCIVQVACKSLSEIAILNMMQDAILNLRISLSRKLLATPYKKLQQLGKSELLVILTNDVDMFVGAFQMMPTALSNLFVIVACLGYMAWMSWKMFLAVIILLAVCVVALQLAQRVPIRRMELVRDQVGQLYQYFRGLIDGSKELKLNAQRGTMFVDEVITPSSIEFKRYITSASRGFILTANLGTIGLYFLLGMVVFLVPQWYPQDRENLSAFALMLLYLIGPISALIGSVPAFTDGGIAIAKIEQLEVALGDPVAAPDGMGAFVSSQPLRLEFRDVCHEYQRDTGESRFTLGPINLRIDQGECVFIVGGNGSGKTTLAMLLCGLYAPESGHVFLNGQVVNEQNLDAFHQHFSAVFADFYLFEDLLMANHPEISARATRYIRELGMEHKVKVVDGKFSTIDLSTGQRKRLALIASYLEDRPIYLFDEWASDQDPVFKRIFYTELLPDLKARGKTVLVITHDDMYFNHADRIVKLQEGKIQTETHDLAAAPACQSA